MEPKSEREPGEMSECEREEELDGVVEWRLEIRNDMAEVGRANGSLEAFLESHEVDPETVFSATLILEEVVTNVIKYGYDDAMDHRILLDASLGRGELVLRIVDDGHEFDPLAVPPPDFDVPLEERSVGGLGIHLLKKLARSVAYDRAAGKNVLTVCLEVKAPS